MLLEQYFAFLKAFKRDTFVLPFEKIPLPALQARLMNGKNDKQFIDLSFLPRRASVYDPSVDNPFDIVIHWRRPNEFMITDYKLDLHQPAVFYNTVEPVDVKPGILGDDWFLSALSILAERPALIERLFLTRHVNEIGIYRVKLCKNGEWQIVTIDDHFPCYPKGEPIFSSCLTNDLWVLILEKAYAKLHGGYYQLRNGFVNEALLDLTGCPSISYDMEDEYVRHFIANGQFWDLIQYFFSEGYLISFSTEAEKRWRTKKEEEKANKELQDQINQAGDPGLKLRLQRQKALKDSLPKGKSFSAILVREVLGNRLINLRAPSDKFRWEGDWCAGSPNWD